MFAVISFPTSLRGGTIVNETRSTAAMGERVRVRDLNKTIECGAPLTVIMHNFQIVNARGENAVGVTNFPGARHAFDGHIVLGPDELRIGGSREIEPNGIKMFERRRSRERRDPEKGQETEQHLDIRGEFSTGVGTVLLLEAMIGVLRDFLER